MNQKIKAIFFDVDGTLYSHRIHDIPASSKQALHALKEKGYRIGIATSRCRYETKNLPMFLQTFPFDAAIYDGGALVMEQDEIMHRQPMKKDVIQSLSEYADKERFAMRYATYDQDYFTAQAPHQIRDEFFRLYLNIPVVKPYEQEEVFNVLLYPQTKQQEKTIMSFDDQVHIVHHRSTIELTAHNIEKSKGIEVMAKRWNITMDEVACFGDGSNDVKMLKQAGLGIAMGNAKEEVKEAADVVCKSIDEDGIYHICKELQFM